MNINLINSVAKAYQARGATLVTKEGLADLTSGLSKGFNAITESVRKAKQKFKDNLAYKSQDFTDLDLQQPQIDKITELYDQYNEGAKMATAVFRGRDFKDKGIDMMNTAKENIDKLYQSLTSFGTTLNFYRDNIDNLSNSNPLLEDVVNGYMVNKNSDFMKKVQIDEDMRAFVQFGDDKIYLDEINKPNLIDKNAIASYDQMLLEAYNGGGSKKDKAKILEISEKQLRKNKSKNSQASVIFDTDERLLGSFMSYLVTDETFVKKVQDPRFSQIKTEVDAYNEIENPTEENQKDLFEKVKDDLRLLMMGDKDVAAYDLYSDFIQFSMKEVDNQYENGKTYLETLEAEQGDKTYSFQKQDELNKKNKAEAFREYLRLLDAGVVAVNPKNGIKYIKKDGKYYVYEDQNDPNLAITYKQATGQDLPNPNQT